MAFRFRKSVKLFPGVRVNLSAGKRGLGVSSSLGGKGATVNMGTRRSSVSIGIPGSGLSHNQQIGGGKGKRRKSVGAQECAFSPSHQRKLSRFLQAIKIIIAVVIGLVVLIFIIGFFAGHR
jgi:hypothetical protein